MSRPSQEAIETFVNITGSSEATAIQKLEEHGGDLNEAVNAYFNEGDINPTNEASVAVIQDDPMDVDDFDQVESRRPPFPLLSPRRNLDLFSSLLDPSFTRNIFDSGTGFTRNVPPIVSHPREVRQIPIEFKNESDHSSHLGNAPVIEDVTESSETHVPESRGIVTFEEADDEDFDTHNNSHMGTFAPTAPRIDDFLDPSNDIEEEMIRAAIEASKQDAPVPLIDDENDSTLSLPRQIKPFEEDPHLAHAVSLSLKTAERERTMRELEGFQDHELGKLSSSDRLDIGSSSVNDEETDDIEEQPLVRHRVSSGFDGTQLSTSQHHPTPSQPAEPSNIPTGGEWGGISSQEQDEALMLEAAMFGGIPEETRNNRFPLPSGLNGNVEHFAWGRQPRPPPPPPSLAAQRLLREQQDDEFYASLQADREKEIKAKEEADAALAERKRQDEESLRKLMEEQEIERQIAAKKESLPKEPSSDDDNGVTLLVRMPDGSRRGRRFFKSDKLQSLFDFIDVEGGVKPGTYRLVRPYPRRAFSNEECGSTLNELGLTSKQEALYLELV